MAEFKIVTDTTADLPKEYIEENELGLLYLSYTICNATYGEGKELDKKEFYRLMREGNMTNTSQVNPTDAKEHFLKYLEGGKDILYIAFSSGLSGTCNSGKIAAQEIMEENPEVNIIVVDTLSASLGEGLLVHKAIQLRKQGKSMEETAAWLEENKLHLVHAFTVDDLNHLYRGGRVSRATAIIGTMANIKPILHVDDSGHLIPVGKVRGRKKSLHALVDYMEERLTGEYKDCNDVVFISHGDALEDALIVRDEVTKRFGVTEFIINDVGPTIGSHSGPGTMALFFLGEKR